MYLKKRGVTAGFLLAGISSVVSGYFKELVHMRVKLPETVATFALFN